MLHRLFSWVWIFAAAFVVFFGLVFGIARVVLNENPEIRHAIEQSVSEQLGLEVRADRISPVWRSISPGLRFENLRISNHEGQPLWQVTRLRIDVAVIQSLVNLGFVPSGVLVDGVHVSLRRGKDGTVSLDGLPAELANRDQPEARQRLAFTLMNTRMDWVDEQGGRPSVQFDDVRLKIRPIAGGYRFRGRVGLPETLGHRLKVGGKIRAPRGDFSQVSGSLYVRGAELNLSGIRSYVSELAEYGDIHGVADLATWFELDKGHVSEIQSRVSLLSPGFTPASPDYSRWAAAKASAVAAWHRTRSGWLISLKDLDARQGELNRKIRDLRVEFRQAGDGAGQVLMSADEIDLSLAAGLAASVSAVGPVAARHLSRMAPTGRLSDFELILDDPGAEATVSVVRAELHNVSVVEEADFPGMSGLTGEIEGSAEQGQLSIRSAGGVFSMPRVFRNPLDVNTLNARLSWHKSDQGLRLKADELVLRTPGISLGGHFRLDFPADDGSPFMDLQMTLADGVVSEVPKHLPARIMPPGGVHWLDHAMVDGRITNGAVAVYGDLGDFPFDHAEGVFQVDFNVEDMILDYHPDWTRIEELVAEVGFHGRRMDINASSGKILGTTLSETLVSIPDLKLPVLLVDGTVRGPFQDMLRVVQESPLKKVYGKALGPMTTVGDSDLDLHMTIPLHGEERPVQVDGSAKLAGNDINFDAWKLRIADANGTLYFSDKGLRANAIDARLFDKPVRIDVAAVSDDRGTGTEVRAIGKLGLETQVREYDWPVLSPAISGETEWQMSVRVPPGDSGSDELSVRMSSDLHGVAIKLPAPAGKTAGELMPFSMETRVTSTGTGPLDIRLGDQVQASIEMSETDGHKALDRGVIKIGEQVPPVEVAQGLGISARLPQMDLPEWLAILESPDQKQPGSAANAPQPSAEPVLRKLLVETDRLVAGSLYFPDMKVSVVPDENDWSIGLSGGLEGELRWPIDRLRQSTARLLLEKASLRRVTRLPGPVAEDTASTLSPLTLPAINARMGNVSLDDVTLGNVVVMAVTRDQGLDLSTLSVSGDWLTLEGSGHWTEQSGRQQTKVALDAKLSELARLFEFVGVKSDIAGAQTHAILDASWKGSPLEFELDRLEGDLDLEIGKGQLSEVDPGAGRLFGLMSIYALPRRLALDFRDVFNKGLGFDKVVGKYHLSDGNAVTEGITMEGPSSRIEIKGRVGLRARDYDQQVTIFAKVGSTLPLAGAIAAGPAIGAALLVADKLFLSQIEGLTKYDYSLTGSWENPDFKRIQQAPIEKEEDPFAEPES